MGPIQATIEISTTNNDSSEHTEETENNLFSTIDNTSQVEEQITTLLVKETYPKADNGAKYIERKKQVFEENQRQPRDQYEYFVEAILGERKRKGVIKYKNRWCGFGSEWDTWEPRKNLSNALIQAYENKKGEKTYRITGAPESARLCTLVSSKSIFHLNGPFNQVLDSQLSYYENNKWFIPGFGFERDGLAGLLACEVEMRFWAQLCMEWQKLNSTVEICPLLMGENWTSPKEERETREKMRKYSKYGFGNRTAVRKKFSSLLQTGKPVLGLVFAPKLRHGSWDFLHVLSVLVVGKEATKRKVFLYNPLVREEAEVNGLINRRVQHLRCDIYSSSPIQLGFGGQVDTTDCYLWSLRFIANAGDNYDFLNEIEWSDYKPY